MNEAEEIKKLKSELEVCKELLVKEQFKIMHLECFLRATEHRIKDTLKGDE